MNLLDIFNAIPQLFNWYSKMPSIKRIQFNHLVVLFASWIILYFNDSQHRKHNALLASGIDAVNNLRSKDQERYTTKLESYSDKFQSFSEELLKQEKELKQIKKEP